MDAVRCTAYNDIQKADTDMTEDRKRTVKKVLAAFGGTVLILLGCLLIYAGTRPDDRDGRIVWSGVFFIGLGLGCLTYLLPPIVIKDKRKKDGPDPAVLLEAYRNGEMDYDAFIKAFGKAFVYYSTPLGDDSSGSRKLFLIPDPAGGAYLPLFTSLEKAAEYHQKEDRAAFMIMNDPFLKVLQTTCAVNRGNPPVQLGLIVDPETYAFSVEAGKLVSVMNQITDRQP